MKAATPSVLLIEVVETRHLIGISLELEVAETDGRCATPLIGAGDDDLEAELVLDIEGDVLELSECERLGLDELLVEVELDREGGTRVLRVIGDANGAAHRIEVPTEIPFRRPLASRIENFCETMDLTLAIQIEDIRVDLLRGLDVRQVDGLRRT